ncbi:MAG: hypothetical protein KatS3mg111_0357 [Pirellulaceae bacterium]|nr:MAG: hypothetical protein KatS3mg111_0357 [Pirellulaceae bacterium]
MIVRCTGRMAPAIALLFLLLLGGAKSNPAAELPQFRDQELPTRLQVGYAVRPVDVNGDGRLDIAIVDSHRVLWLENPGWQEHVVYASPDAPHDNVCFAPHDIDGDGDVDFALGADWQFNNTDSGGTIGWLEHVPSGPWRYHPITSEPTTHRMNWADLRGDGTLRLVVAPLKGRGTRPPTFDQRGIRLLELTPPDDPATGAWTQQVLTERLTVTHNFEVVDWDEDGRDELLIASFEGIHHLRVADGGRIELQRIGSGQETPAPKRGASEIRHGRLGSGRLVLGTIEPWHGDKVVVYLQPPGDRDRFGIVAAICSGRPTGLGTRGGLGRPGWRPRSRVDPRCSRRPECNASPRLADLRPGRSSQRSLESNAHRPRIRRHRRLDGGRLGPGWGHRHRRRRTADPQRKNLLEPAESLGHAHRASCDNLQQRLVWTAR